ncbi:twin-arginine translocase subunit TatC [Methanococcoides sp. SA1]|nr:twin-arginine translocase subunit TatC [Methanococcoides sp. SA1]
MEAYTSLVIVLSELRRSIRAVGLSVGIGSLALFFLAPQLLTVVQGHLSEKLYFFSVAGPFLAHVKLALFAVLFVLMPWLMTVLWRALAKPFRVKGLQLILFVLFTVLLFYAGTMFCYFITLPFGVKFLLGFGSQDLQPVISISRFVNFVVVFVLAFGVVFELPVFMVFLAKVGVCPRGFFEKNRRYALLLISILSAILTPTPDVVNMLLMGGPLYLLYEVGILVLMAMRIK